MRPEGATPKDGPSAGIAMTTALVSVLDRYSGSRQCRDDGRNHVAWRSPADWRPQAEKLLAAHRGGIKLVLVPKKRQGLTEIPDNVKNAIEIVPVRWIDKVLELALGTCASGIAGRRAEAGCACRSG